MEVTRERFEQMGWKMTYEEYQQCNCSICNESVCSHRGAYRRVPKIDDGLALCKNLKKR